MVFELDITLNPVLAPLAWLVGRWEGAGVLGYPTIESANFGQELEITHDGRPFLEMSSHTWLLDDAELSKLVGRPFHSNPGLPPRFGGVDELPDGQARLAWDVRIDIDGEERPALVARWLTQIAYHPGNKEQP